MTVLLSLKLRELQKVSIPLRPLVIDNCPKANAARSFAWALFDNAELLLTLLEAKEAESK